MSLIVPIPKVPIHIRAATMADVPFMDGLQKKTSRAVGFMTGKMLEGYVGLGAVLVAEAVTGDSLLVTGGDGGVGTSNKEQVTSNTRLGYVISRDRYLKRDELGIIYQMNIAPEARRMLVGAALVGEVFARSAWGCRLYCLWC